MSSLSFPMYICYGVQVMTKDQKWRKQNNWYVAFDQRQKIRSGLSIINNTFISFTIKV